MPATVEKKWAVVEGSRVSMTAEEANEAGAEVSRLARECGGEDLPQNIVNVAREKGHCLHGEFEWDDHIAAEASRRDRARQLARSFVLIEITIEEVEPRPPELISISRVEPYVQALEADEENEDDGRRNGRKYVFRSQAIEDVEGVRALERTVVKRIAGFERDLEGLDRLKPLRNAIRKAKKTVGLE